MWLIISVVVVMATSVIFAIVVDSASSIVAEIVASTCDITSAIVFCALDGDRMTSIQVSMVTIVTTALAVLVF